MPTGIGRAPYYFDCRDSEWKKDADAAGRTSCDEIKAETRRALLKSDIPQVQGLRSDGR